MGVRVCLPDLGLPAGGAAARLLSSRRRHGLSDRSRRVTGGGCSWLSHGSGRIRCGWRDVPGANLEGRRPAARQCHRSCPRQRTGALGCGTRPGLVAPPVNPQRNHWRHCLAVSFVQRPVRGRWRCPRARLRALLLFMHALQNTRPASCWSCAGAQQSHILHRRLAALGHRRT